jgi:Uma2 family endonuclease
MISALWSAIIRRHERFGFQEYWIIDEDEQKVIVYRSTPVGFGRSRCPMS